MNSYSTLYFSTEKVTFWLENFVSIDVTFRSIIFPETLATFFGCLEEYVGLDRPGASKKYIFQENSLRSWERSSVRPREVEMW